MKLPNWIKEGVNTCITGYKWIYLDNETITEVRLSHPRLRQ